MHRKWGGYVVVADYDVDSPAKKIADEAVLIDATNADLLVDYCIKNNIDGIATGFLDILFPSYYEVCHRLNLPCYITELMMEMSTNKTVFKEKCKENGLLIPETHFVGGKIEKKLYETIKYPVFVKPLDASGSRGAGVCNNREELDRQFAEALEFSKSNNAIIEEYLVGREFILDYVGVNGEFKLLSMFDRYMSEDRDSARNYANVSLCPSKAIGYYYENINEKVIKMFKNLGFTDGLIFLQGYYDGENIKFYEMGCRLGGSFSDLEQTCLGMTPVDMIVRYALSGKMLEDIDDIKDDSANFKRVAMAANYLLDGGDDTIALIVGNEEIETLDSYVGMLQLKKVGDYYVKDTIVDKPVMTYFMVFSSLEEASRTLKYMNQIVRVENDNGDSLLMKKLDSKEILI